jgi:septum formation protein
MKKRLVLASASPRRKEILELAGYDFEIRPSGADEISKGCDPCEVARLNALAKAKEVFAALGGKACVLGADTIVTKDGAVLGKPVSEEDAFQMLSLLSGSSHQVVTGFAVVSDLGEDSGFTSTDVVFRHLSTQEICQYIATKEPMDKAGSYGIQEKGCLLVEYIKGDFFNVVGLPVADLAPLLEKHGISPNWKKEIN